MANSKVLIENDKTIVTEWSFDIGDSTGLHTHEYNYIVVPMLDGELKVIDNNSHETNHYLFLIFKKMDNIQILFKRFKD